MKIPNKILDCVADMDVRDEDSLESEFPLDNKEFKCNISSLISSLEDESIDSIEEQKLKASNVSFNSDLELKKDNNNSIVFPKLKNVHKKLKVSRTKPPKTNGHIHKTTPKTTANRSNKKLVNLVRKSEKLGRKKSQIEEFVMFKEISLDDEVTMKKVVKNFAIKVQNYKPFIGNRNFYEGLFIKSLSKRITMAENNHKKLETPKIPKKITTVKPKPGPKKIETPIHIEEVQVREIVNCDLIEPSTDVVKEPKLNQSPLKSILTNSPMATPNSVNSSLRTPKKVTFCNVIFVKNIEVDYEAENGPSEDCDYESFDDDDSDDSDFKL